MNSLQVLACLLGLLVLCQSDCVSQKLEMKDINHPPQGCVDKAGQQHAFDSEWVTADCKACTCTDQGMSCCNKLPSPSGEEVPPECDLVVDRKACSFKFVMKSDETKECDFA